MTGGVLRLVTGTTWTEYCVDRGAGEPVPLHRGGGFQDLGNGRALVLYYTSSGAGTVPSDTLTVSGDEATLHFRQGASVTDVLRFERIAGAEKGRARRRALANEVSPTAAARSRPWTTRPGRGCNRRSCRSY